MSKMEQQLLFFDTFSHENTEDLNLDLVQFPCPVLITGLRVIPLGTRVQVDLPRGERLGATNPSSFKLEFFVNNLSKVGASTFEKLGFLEYKQNVDIEVLPEGKVATDGLILKGWYTTLTLAVYGCVTTVARETSSPPPPPPQPRTQVVCSSGPAEVLLPVPDFRKPPPNTFTHTTPAYAPPPHQPEYVRPPPPEFPIKSEFIQPPDFSRPPPTAFDTIVPVHKQEPVLGLASPPKSPLDRTNTKVGAGEEERRHSDGDPCDIPLDHRSTGESRPRDPRDKDEEIKGHWSESRGEYTERHSDKHARTPPPSEGPHSPHETGTSESRGCRDENSEMYNVMSDSEMQEGDGYSDISSDEDNLLSRFEDGNIRERMGEWDVQDSDYPWSFATASFNPCQCDFAPLETFTDPSLTDYQKAKPTSDQPDAASEILQIVETYKNAEHREKWVEALEGLPAIVVPGLVYLQNCKEHKDILDMLIEWTLEGLDLEKAIAQPVAAFKVRHLKMGIRLCGALCQCDEDIALKLIHKDVQRCLFDLYESQYMSSSVKLYIVNALDATTRFSAGLQWMLGMHPLQVTGGASTEKNTEALPGEDQVADIKTEPDIKTQVLPSSLDQVDTSQPLIGYQRLINILINKERVRCVTTLTAFLNKVHIYEVLVNLEKTVNELADYQANAEQMKLSHGTDSENDTAPETDIEMTPTETISHCDLEMITSCLREVAKVIVNAQRQIAQPQRTLPNRVQFAVKRQPYDPYPNLFHMFNACRLLECIFVLFASPLTSAIPGVFYAARDLLINLLATQHGLLYLSSRPDTTNGIVRALTQHITDYTNHEESREDTAACQQLGLQMIYCVQTVQFLDQLKEYHAKDSSVKSVDDAEVLGVLHSLYSMTISMQARRAVARVLSLQDNMHVFLPFVELSGDPKKDDALQHSVCHNYTLMILLIVLRHSEHVNWLDEKFVTKLIAFTESEGALPSPSSSSKVAERMSEIRDWLQPVCKQTGAAPTAPLCSLESLPALITRLKTYAEDMRDPPPRCLATVLRLIRQLAIPAEQTAFEQDDYVELKYKYVVMELFSADCLTVLVSILQKLSDTMLLPWQQGIPLHGPKAIVTLAIIKSTLAIVKPMFSIVIEARGTAFKDLSALPCLIKLHTVVCSVSASGSLNSQLQQIQNDIVDILLTFTQPLVEDNEEAYGSSLWTEMVKAILDQMFTAPYMFLSCLIILSEMLPLPLPVQTRDPLSPTEVTKALDIRKQWSHHLLPLTSQIQTLIKQLATSSNPSLQQLLQRVCCQIADLAANTSLMAVRSLLDCLLDSMDASIDRSAQLNAPALIPTIPTPGAGATTTTPAKEATNEEDKAGEEKRPLRDEVQGSVETARILKLIASLIRQVSIKVAFLHLCRTSGNKKPDEKYADVIYRLVCLLNVVSNDKVSHIKAQEFIVVTIQSLCDIEVSLVSRDSNTPYLAQLSNSLPSGAQLQLLCAGLLEHIDQRDHGYSSILLALRTLIILTEHDYGFYHTKCGLEKVPTALFNLFFRIDSTFSKDSSDCIETLSSAVYCIQYLVTLPDGATSGGSDERTFTMSSTEMRSLLRWSRDLETHPLDDLDKLLQDYAKDEDTLKAIYDSVNSVLRILNAEDDRPGTEVTEPILPAVESPSSQFNQRTVYVVVDMDDDDRLHTAYWLSTLPGDDSDQESDVETCDLEAMSKEYCPEFNLQAELSKDSLAPEMTANKPRRRSRVARHSQNTINTSRLGSNASKPAPFAPMRGRGFNRGNSNRSDPFRSRTPNTSRPPSMHVDDFLKMSHDTPANNAGGAQRRMESGRGRGGDRGQGFSTRGRIFSPPANYNRRDGGFPGSGGSYNARNVGNTPMMSIPNTHVGNSGIMHVGVNSGNRMGGGGGVVSSRNTVTSPATWMASRTVRQNYGFMGHISDGRQPGMERADRRHDDNPANQRFVHMGGYWAGAKNGDRFASTGNQSFYGRRDRGRHDRSFTK